MQWWFGNERMSGVCSAGSPSSAQGWADSNTWLSLAGSAWLACLFTSSLVGLLACLFARLVLPMASPGPVLAFLISAEAFSLFFDYGVPALQVPR
ncbi:hypothetical protein B0I35DRAFT_419390 [Stachybotrys elegans]|uniref:Uncharacterized protein n=1 Tax=Stachybotrys elegans TaxID=80388 RepID=A0A8K0WYP7_9HYPO|nr:hypothetical protein B0I35DRAFT_419390 [Stachybotrys elegans]